MTAAKKTTRPANRNKAAKGRSAAGFSDEERAAMKERAKELKADRARGEEEADDARMCSPRSPRCRNQIARWPSASMRSSRPLRQI